MFRLVEDSYEDVKGSWEDRFEAKYGRWRGFVDDVVYAFTDCGDLGRGFARVYCDACRSEYLLAFSCSRRGFCPACAAKRGAIFGAFLQEEILEEVGHGRPREVPDACCLLRRSAPLTRFQPVQGTLETEFFFMEVERRELIRVIISDD